MKTVAMLAFVSLAVAAPAVVAQTTYQWKDPVTGRMIFSDQPPPPGTKGVGMKTGDAPTDTNPVPYATRRAAERFPVVLYTSADCVEHCNSARKLLNDRGVPFAEKMVQGNASELLAELKAVTGGEATVPVMRVGEQHFKGFEAGGWNNLLDLAGYPKTAPFGSKPSGAFTK